MEGVSIQTIAGFSFMALASAEGSVKSMVESSNMPRRASASKAPAPAIAVVRDKQSVAWLEHGVKHQSLRRKAAGSDHAAASALKFGNGLGKLVAGRIAAPAVIVSPLLADPCEGEVG